MFTSYIPVRKILFGEDKIISSSRVAKMINILAERLMTIKFYSKPKRQVGFIFPLISKHIIPKSSATIEVLTLSCAFVSGTKKGEGRVSIETNAKVPSNIRSNEFVFL